SSYRTVRRAPRAALFPYTTLFRSIWGAWGHKSTHTVSESWAAERVLPATLDPLCGIFSHVGAIALNALLDADVHVGEYVAVFGQDRKSTRLNSSHVSISYAVFCLK